MRAVIEENWDDERVSELPVDRDSERDFFRECEFLRQRVKALASGRFRDEHEDIVHDAWIRLDRALRRDPARNADALMTRVAWRSWIDFWRRKASLGRTLGAPVDPDDVVLTAEPPEPAVDVQALALWRFAVCEWFRKNRPACLESASQFFAGCDFVRAAATSGVRPNSLAKRWQRCKDYFVRMVRTDAGDLREILAYFEAASG